MVWVAKLNQALEDERLTLRCQRIQAIDMGRRGIHDEGSRALMERLSGKVRIDFETARRLFTLICVLHWKG